MLEKSAEGAPQRATSWRSKFGALVHRAWTTAMARRSERRLRLCEMLSLGEKRFIAVVECDRRRFLLAGTPQNIALLERLQEDADDYASVGRQSIRAEGGKDFDR